MLICIGRSTDGALTLGLANEAKDFLSDPVIAGGIVIEGKDRQEAFENITAQLQIMQAWKTPIAITQNFAVTYREAKETIKFLANPEGYTARE